MTLFNKLFSESFDTLSTKDVKDGVIAGVVSPYLGSSKDEIGLALDDLDSRKAFINNKISKMHTALSLNMKLGAASDLNGFSMFSSRLVRALELNKVFEDDPVIQKKLADLLTYFYIKLSKQTSTYLIYDDINQAKKVAGIVFKKAEKYGLDFLPPSVSDMLKVVLLSVFYKLPADKKSSGSSDKSEGQAPPQ
jgi:hypothetical protein